MATIGDDDTDIDNEEHCPLAAIRQPHLERRLESLLKRQFPSPSRKALSTHQLKYTLGRFYDLGSTWSLNTSEINT